MEFNVVTFSIAVGSRLFLPYGYSKISHRRAVCKSLARGMRVPQQSFTLWHFVRVRGLSGIVKHGKVIIFPTVGQPAVTCLFPAHSPCHPYKHNILLFLEAIIEARDPFCFLFMLCILETTFRHSEELCITATHAHTNEHAQCSWVGM